VSPWDGDLVMLPVDVPVLNPHLALSTAGLQSADEAVVHQRPDVLVLPCVHGEGRIEQPLLFVA
jgi:hypothetical protein